MSVWTQELDEATRGIEISSISDKPTRFATFQEAFDFILLEQDFAQVLSLSTRKQLNDALASIQKAKNAESFEEALPWLQSALSLLNLREHIFSFSAKGKFLMGLPPELREPALRYFQGRLSLDTPEDFGAAIAAALFLRPPFTDDLKAHLSAAAHMIDQSRQELGSIEQARESATTLLDGYISTTTEQLTNLRATWTERLETQHTKQHDAWQNLHSEYLSKFIAVYNAYDEKLRLEVPASYWKELEESYNERGRNYVHLTVMCVTLSALIILMLLYFPPKVWESTYTPQIVKSAAAFLLLSSLIAYLVTLFVRLATSAYHLARDARERFQLTHIYLALAQTGVVKDEDRSIILKSLFSRAETGLLKGESGPSFPDQVKSLIVHDK